MKYIQSFYNYAVTFSSIAKGVPAKNAEGDLRNIVEVTEAELEKLKSNEPLFRKLVDQKKYRVLDKLPESYKPAATLVNEARAQAEEAKKEVESLKAQLADKEKESGNFSKKGKAEKKDEQKEEVSAQGE